MLRRPLRCVDVELTSVDGHRLSRKLVADVRLAEGCTPIPTVARSTATSRPKISQMQISAERSGSSS